MNKIEFLETMKFCGIKREKENNSFYYNGVLLNFDDDRNVIVKGKVPLEVANTIYKKYDSVDMGIRLHDSYENLNPNDYIFEDDKNLLEYVEDYYKYNCMDKKHLENMGAIRKELNSNFVTDYYIDDLRGLIIFLTELQEYYLKNGIIKEDSKLVKEELNSQIIDDLVFKARLHIGANEWMALDSKNKNKYFKTIDRMFENDLDSKIRELIFEFDNTVNPYSNENIKLDNSKNYLENVTVSIDINGVALENYVELKISDKNYNYVLHQRKSNAFNYQLRYGSDDRECIVHLYHAYIDDEEELEMSFLEGHQQYIYNYDLTNNNYKESNNVLFKNRGKEKPITDNEKLFIIDSLEHAIVYSRRITIDNMALKENKQLKK